MNNQPKGRGAMIPTLTLITTLLLAPLAVQADLNEDFSAAADKVFESWVPYGRLADGTWAQGVGQARPEWWALENGALRGQNFPEEKHPAGLSRKEHLPQAKLAETGARISWRIKVTATSRGTLRLFGLTTSPHDKDATDNHVLALDVSSVGGITPGTWHALVLEVKGNEARAFLDGKHAVNLTLPHDQPLRSLSLEADGDKKTIGLVWFDDIIVEAL
jgi:hypothetical protein